MTDEYMLRVDAGDLADIISDRMSARADLETCIRDATEAQAQFQQELDNAHHIYRSFRRAVQEAVGLDQPDLLSEEELVAHIRIARTGTGDVTVSPVTPNDVIDQLVHDKLLTQAAGEHFKSVQPVEPRSLVGPWTAPEQQDGPPIQLEVDVTHLRAAQRVMAEQYDREQQWQAEQVQDGPPTESMPPVEQPPEVAPPQSIGRVFTRGYDWDLGDLMPTDMINRSGDWWEFDHTPDGENGDQAVYRCEALEKIHTFAELLHMHGTLWEVLQPDAVPELGAVDHG